MEKKIQFLSDGLKIRGILSYPTNGHTPWPAVVLLHGFTSHKDEDLIISNGVGMFHYTAVRFNEGGFASLRFDFRGHGESDGAFEDLTIADLVSDTLAAVSFLAKQKEVDDNRIGLLGQSLGGLIVAYTACRDRRIKIAVLWNTPSNPFHTFSSILCRHSLREVFQRGRISFSWEDKGEFSLKSRFFHDLVVSSPLVEIAKFHGPLMVVVGTKDEYIFPQPQMGEAYIQAHGGRSDLIKFESDHTFSISNMGVSFLDEAVQKSIDWFNSADQGEQT